MIIAFGARFSHKDLSGDGQRHILPDECQTMEKRILF